MGVFDLLSANKCYQGAMVYLIRDSVRFINDREVGVNLTQLIFSQNLTMATPPNEVTPLCT